MGAAAHTKGVRVCVCHRLRSGVGGGGGKRGATGRTGQRGEKAEEGVATRATGQHGGIGAEVMGCCVGGLRRVGYGGGGQMVQLQAKHYFSLLNKRFHGAGRCLAETAECH